MASPPEPPDPPGLWQVAGAFLRRDALQAASYRVAFVARFASVLLALWAFALMARFVGDGGPEVPGGYLGFWVLGVATAELFHVCASALPGRLREAQLAGTLEAALSTPARDGHVALAGALWDVLSGCSRFVVYLLAATWFLGVELGPVAALPLVALAPLALAAFLALGLVGGALTLVLRRTDPVSALAWAGAAALGGVFYPVSALPAWLRPVGELLPIAPALEIARAALFQGAGLDALGGAFARLAGFTAVALPLGALALRAALRRARIDGSLGQY